MMPGLCCGARLFATCESVPARSPRGASHALPSRPGSAARQLGSHRSVASAIGAETSGHSANTMSQRRRRSAGKRHHHGRRTRRPGLDVVEVPHRGQASGLQSVEPARQTLGGSASGAQAPCPANSQRREDRPLALAGCDPCCGDCGFHPVARLAEAREAPEVKAHAGARDRMQITRRPPSSPATHPRGPRRARPLRRCFRGHGGQGTRTGPPPAQDRPSGAARPIRPGRAPAVSSCTPDRRSDIQSARRSGPTRSPANQLRSAASISASRCRHPSGPRRSRSSSAPSRPDARARRAAWPASARRQSSRTAVSRGSARGPGGRSSGFSADRTRQEPQVVFGVPPRAPRHRREDYRSHHAVTGCLRLHMCKIRAFCKLPKGFCRGASCSLYSTRARWSCEISLIALSAAETKGFLTSSATEQRPCIRLQTVVYS